MTRRRQSPSGRQGGSRRAGFTLTEMLIVISLIAMISTGAAVLIGSLMGIDADTGAEVVEQITRSRFREQFRADVHAATTATISTSAGSTLEDPPSTTLTLFIEDGHTAEYVARADAVELTVHRDGDVVMRERFALRGRKTFAHRDDRSIVLYTQHVKASGSTDADDLQELLEVQLQIQAALGYDRRHSSSASAGGGEE